MKFIAFSDTHTSLFLHRKIVSCVKEYKVDMLVCVGDFTLFCNFWKESLQELEKADIPMVFIPGNHEYRENIVEQINKFSFVINVDRNSHCIDNTIFCGYGAMQYPQEISKWKCRKICSKIKKIKKEKNLILLSHVPPEGFLVAKPKRKRSESDAGSEMTAQFLRELRPDLLLCGHIHVPQERVSTWEKTRIHNIACQAHVYEVTAEGIQWKQQISFEKWD